MTTTKGEALREGRPSEADHARAAAARLAKVGPALERVGAIDARLAVISAEVKVTRRGLLPREEIAARLVTWLRGRQERFERPYSATGERRQVPAVVTQLSVHDAYNVSGPEEAFDLLVWLIGPERLEEGAREALARVEYAEGPPSAERDRRRAGLDAERARLVAEREPLVEVVRAAGIAFEHLPETQERLNADARAEELRAKDRARQRAGEDEIEARESRA